MHWLRRKLSLIAGAIGGAASIGATARGVWRTTVGAVAAAVIAAGLTFVFRGIPQVEGGLHDISSAIRALAHAESAENKAASVAVVSLVRAADGGAPSAAAWADAIEAAFDVGAETVALEIELAEPGPFSPEEIYAPLVATAWRHRNDLLVGAVAGATAGPETFAAVAGVPTSVATHEPSREEDGIIRIIPAQGRDLGTSLAIEAGVRFGAERAALQKTLHFAPVFRPDSIAVYEARSVIACARSPGERPLEGKLVVISSRPAIRQGSEHAARFLSRRAVTDQPNDCLEPRPALVDAFVESAQLHAWSAVTFASGDWAYRAPLVLSAVIAAAAAGLGAFTGGSMRLHGAILCWIAIMIGALIASTIALELGLRASIGGAFIAAPVAGAFTAAARRISEERTRRQVEMTFGRFLPPQIVQELVDGGSSVIEPGGEVRPVAVMFADLAGFTEISAQLEPKTLVSVVNRYLEVIVTAVEARRGYVDKFIGDAVMALWGAPLPDDEAAARAAQTAIDVRNAIMRRMKQDQDRGLPAFGVKIGVASGPAVVGNVGTSTRLSYTAMGQTVNVASRLEGLAVTYRCVSVLDPSTAEAARDVLLLRELDRVVVKGTRDPIAVYEPIGLRASATAEQRRLVDAYSVGLARYRARRFEDALKIWTSLAEHDGPSAVMAEEARRLILDPPRSTWDAARRMTSK